MEEAERLDVVVKCSITVAVTLTASGRECWLQLEAGQECGGCGGGQGMGHVEAAGSSSGMSCCEYSWCMLGTNLDVPFVHIPS